MTSKGKIIIIEDNEKNQPVEQTKRKIQIIKSTHNSVATNKINKPEKDEKKEDMPDKSAILPPKGGLEKKEEPKIKDISVKYKTLTPVVTE